jgi:hypothetical protein
MSGAGVAVAADFLTPLTAGWPPLRTVGPSAITDAEWPLRALIAVLVVGGFGAVLVRSHGPFVDRSIDASIERPLSSFGYGVAAHAVIAFTAVYLANKFARLAPLGGDGPLIGLLVGALLLLCAAVIGFTVVGATVAELGGDRRRSYGLALGALTAGAAAAVATPVGVVVWFVVVSVGIGGAIRRWVHASALPEP